MVEIKIAIPNDKVDELKLGFKAAVPQVDEYEGLTDMQFFKKWIMNQIKNIYRTGKINIARETTIPIIEEVIDDVV